MLLAAVVCAGLFQLAAPDSMIVPMLADTTVDVEVVVFPAKDAALPIWYEVIWGDGDTLTWSGPLQNNADVSRYHRYRTYGEFTVQARIKDGLGTISDWSSPLTVKVGEPIQRWSFATEDAIVCAPSLDLHGNIYFGDEGGVIYSLTPGGDPRWNAKARDAVYGAPVIIGNRVYVTSLDSTLYCFDTAGKSLWNLNLGDALYCPPAVGADGALYIGTDVGWFASVAANGKLRWKRKLGDELAAPPTIGVNGLIYQTADSVYCFDSKGRRRWAFGAPEGDYFFAAAIPDPSGVVYAGNNDGYLYCIGPDGRLRWRSPGPDADEIRPEVTVGLDGTLYYGDDGYYCVRKPVNGTPSTVYEANDVVIAAAAISDKGTVYYMPDDGTLYAFANGARLLYSRDVVDGSKEVYYTGSPVIAPDGTIYTTSWDGGIYAFRGDGPPAATWWPQYRHDAQHTGRVLPLRRR